LSICCGPKSYLVAEKKEVNKPTYPTCTSMWKSRLKRQIIRTEKEAFVLQNNLKLSKLDQQMFSFPVRLILTQGIYNDSHAEGTYNSVRETKYHVSFI
jgi:hypothetical protein